MDEVRENSEVSEQVSDAIASALVPDRVQPNGGKLRSGNPGNRGGGRPKESLRRRMRRILGKSLAAIERDLDAVNASENTTGVLANQTKRGAQQGPLTRADAVRFAEVAAKYGIGKEDKREVETKETRYIIRLPQRPVRAVESAPIRVVNPPALLPTDQQSAAARDE